MKEDYGNIWYHLQEFPECQYEINKLGEIRNKKSMQKLKGTISKDGYLAYLLTINGKSYRRLAHVLVAKQFLPNPQGYPVVNHIDENKLNPCIDNLEWITYAENSLHGTAQERSGERRSKPINEYDLDGRYLRTWKSVKEIYCYHKLPYDREHRPTYLIKILANNDEPDSSKIVFAQSIFLRYKGSTDNIDVQLKAPTNIRNEAYKNLKRAKIVPEEYLFNPNTIMDGAIDVLQEMIDTNQFLFSSKQVLAIQYAIRCIDEIQKDKE